MSAHTTVILGGGVGGIVTANELRQRAARSHRIILVEKNPEHAFAPSFLWLMVGDRTREQIVRPVRQLVRKGVEVVHATARRIDVENRRVELDNAALDYDSLVVALGAELAWDAIPGLSGAAHTFYSLDGAIQLRDTLRAFQGGIVAVVVCGIPYKCPGAPHEGAMLVADFLSSDASFYAVRRRGFYAPDQRLRTPRAMFLLPI